jgi:hypothetical protein
MQPTPLQHTILITHYTFTNFTRHPIDALYSLLTLLTKTLLNSLLITLPIWPLT